jgi:hypothetical protein
MEVKAYRMQRQKGKGRYEGTGEKKYQVETNNIG